MLEDLLFSFLGPHGQCTPGVFRYYVTISILPRLNLSGCNDPWTLVVECIRTTCVNVTFWFPIWRSLNQLECQLTAPKGHKEFQLLFLDSSLFLFFFGKSECKFDHGICQLIEQVYSSCEIRLRCNLMIASMLPQFKCYSWANCSDLFPPGKVTQKKGGGTLQNSLIIQVWKLR